MGEGFTLWQGTGKSEITLQSVKIF